MSNKLFGVTYIYHNYKEQFRRSEQAMRHFVEDLIANHTYQSMTHLNVYLFYEKKNDSF